MAPISIVLVVVAAPWCCTQGDGCVQIWPTTNASPLFATRAPQVAWESDVAPALARARAAGRPAIVDFYADWCATCRRLDEEVWMHAGVRRASTRFVAVRVDMTRPSADADAMQHAFGVDALPAVLFVDSAGQLMREPRVRAYIAPADMSAVLRRVR